MKFGIATFVNDDSIDTVTLARAIEERGFESLMVAEHTHIPASRESPYPLGGELPKIYYRTLDPFVTLAAAAAVTSKIELFTGIALLIQRDPIITAKEAASIDVISGGRFVFGVGAGWNIEEMRDHGTDPKTRGALLDERIEAIKALWADEPAEYHGTYVDFPRRTAGPNPFANRIHRSFSAEIRPRRSSGWCGIRPVGSPTRSRSSTSPAGCRSCATPPGTTCRWRCSAHRKTPIIGRPPKSWDSVGWGCCCPPNRGTTRCGAWTNSRTS